MSIHHNINIPAIDLERLHGNASIKFKEYSTSDDFRAAYWAGVADTFEQIGKNDPPTHNSFIAELERRLNTLMDGEA